MFIIDYWIAELEMTSFVGILNFMPLKALFDVGAVRCRDSQFLSQVSSVELEERGLGNRVSLNWLIKKNGPSFSLLPLI